jgi:hypothetical protein
MSTSWMLCHVDGALHARKASDIVNCGMLCISRRARTQAGAAHDSS